MSLLQNVWVSKCLDLFEVTQCLVGTISGWQNVFLSIVLCNSVAALQCFPQSCSVYECTVYTCVTLKVELSFQTIPMLCTVYSVQCTVCSVQCIVYSVQYTLYTALDVHCKLHCCKPLGRLGWLLCYSFHGQQRSDKKTWTSVQRKVLLSRIICKKFRNRFATNLLLIFRLQIDSYSYCFYLQILCSTNISVHKYYSFWNYLTTVLFAR